MSKSNRIARMKLKTVLRSTVRHPKKIPLWLRRMRGSHLRLYEILEVKADEGFALRDLWDDRRLWVRELLGTRELATWM